MIPKFFITVFLIETPNRPEQLFTLPCGPQCQTWGDSSCPVLTSGSPTKASAGQLETSAIHFVAIHFVSREKDSVGFYSD